MAGGSRGSRGSSSGTVHGAELEPIRVVRRVLTRPDGTTVQVDVPVYPPFRLEERPDGSAGKGRRTAPAVRGRRQSSTRLAASRNLNRPQGVRTCSRPLTR